VGAAATALPGGVAADAVPLPALAAGNAALGRGATGAAWHAAGAIATSAATHHRHAMLHPREPFNRSSPYPVATLDRLATFQQLR
jgi:hypothetical protein